MIERGVETFPEGGVHLERQERTAWVTIDRPPLNVLDLEAFERLGAILKEVVSGPRCDVVVIGAEGEKAFSAGAHIADHTSERAPSMLKSFHEVARALWKLPVVSVAAVKGVALGGGMELAMCCDIVVASETATFGQPEIKLGCFPPIAAAMLPAIVGRARAADLIMTGRTIDGKEAHAMGLVSRLAAPERFDDAVREVVAELGSNSSAVMRLALKALRHHQTPAFERALAENERIYLDELIRLPDASEGVEAFLQKREPRWES